MNRIGLSIASCALLGACTVLDVGVGRGAENWEAELGASAYMELGWSTQDELLSLDLFGGPNPYTLVRADVWRLLHLELGLLGVGIGLGPLQFGAGFGLYAPEGPGHITDDDPLDD